MTEHLITQTPRRCYSIRETATTLGVSQSSVRRLIHRGILKPIRVLRHLLIPVNQIDDLLK